MFFPLLIPFGDKKIKFSGFVATLLIVFLNIIVHLGIELYSGSYEEKIQEKMSDEYLVASLKIYKHFVSDHPKIYSAQDISQAKESKISDVSTIYMYIKKMYSDQYFLENYKYYKNYPDKVLLSWWRVKTFEFDALKISSPSYQLGVKINNQWWSFLTYQFVHGGWFHLISNMIFLFIVGRILEPILGSVLFLLAYLGLGVMAGLFYYQFGGASDLPLVGASGSISGILSLWLILFWRRNISYLYFLMIPVKDYMGVIYLPGYTGLFLWVSYDLLGFLNVDSSQVAFSAHVGGHFFGMSLGLVLLFLFKIKGMATNNGLLIYNRLNHRLN